MAADPGIVASYSRSGSGRSSISMQRLVGTRPQPQGTPIRSLDFRGPAARAGQIGRALSVRKQTDLTKHRHNDAPSSSISPGCSIRRDDSERLVILVHWLPSGCGRGLQARGLDVLGTWAVFQMLLDLILCASLAFAFEFLEDLLTLNTPVKASQTRWTHLLQGFFERVRHGHNNASAHDRCGYV